jgi:hypothetical protein
MSCNTSLYQLIGPRFFLRTQIKESHPLLRRKSSIKWYYGCGAACSFMYTDTYVSFCISVSALKALLSDTIPYHIRRAPTSAVVISKFQQSCRACRRQASAGQSEVGEVFLDGAESRRIG